MAAKSKTPVIGVEAIVPGESRVRQALEVSLKVASHLGDLDAAAVEAARALADKIDAWDTIVRWAVEDAQEAGGVSRPKVPQNDNVSISAFAKLLHALGLTPESRGVKGGSITDVNVDDTPQAKPEDEPFDPSTI